MIKQEREPRLQFDFADKDGNIQTSIFQQAEKVLVALTIEEVIPKFEEVERALEEGYYAAGYLSYEAAPAFNSSLQVCENYQMPLLWFGIFKEPTSKQKEEHRERFSVTNWEASVPKDVYKHHITSIKNEIEQGNTYQVNYTMRMNATFSGDVHAFYKQLSKAQQANYSALLQLGKHSIVSASPELFFRKDANKITTKPMKGTIQRGLTVEDDKNKQTWLSNSIKNKAENVMIVDLLRNDLGVIANTGTVKVPHLFDIEQYPTVHQMTSTVIAEVDNQTTIIDIFRALFPCGSITGAPKKRTMKIITSLENQPREVYCGAIGFLTPNKDAVFNVPIRTTIINHETGQAQYGVGGGVTWDSTSREEYEEIITKAQVLRTNRPDFSLLESIRLIDGKCPLLPFHLDRLKRSAEYFHYQYEKENLVQALESIAATHKQGAYKLRLLLSKEGCLEVEAAPLSLLPELRTVRFAQHAVDSSDVFLYHKTTNREVYEQAKKCASDVFDVLLWNENEEVTEFTIGNVVAEIEGKLYTPTVTSGLLAGTFRKMLLQEGTITERKLFKNDIRQATKIWLINSVRGWVEVHLHDKHS